MIKVLIQDAEYSLELYELLNTYAYDNPSRAGGGAAEHPPVDRRVSVRCG